MSPSSVLLAAMLAAAPVSGTEFPASPSEVTCPAETKPVEASDRFGYGIKCIRGDGQTLGPDVSWYRDGSPMRFQTLVQTEEQSLTQRHGRDVYFQPDGTKAWDLVWNQGRQNGEQRTWIDGELGTRVVENETVLDVFAGELRPKFLCGEGQRVRTRLSSGHIRSVYGSEGSPYLERWCESLSLPRIRPELADPFVPIMAFCVATSEGVVTHQRDGSSSRSDRVPFPMGLDREDPAQVQALCQQADFWREGVRSGSYVSRDQYGRPLEEGEWVEGLRDGTWRIHGHACVGFSMGTPLGRVPCPEGPGPADSWVNELSADVARRTNELGWWPLERSKEESEIRIWDFSLRGSDNPWPDPEPFVVRIVGREAEAAGELASWFDAPAQLERCHESQPHNICRFRQPSVMNWPQVAYELSLLDSWELPKAKMLRLPMLVGKRSARRSGLFIEIRASGSTQRDWYGEVDFESSPVGHQIRSIRGFIGLLWRDTLRRPEPYESVRTPPQYPPADWPHRWSQPPIVEKGESLEIRAAYNPDPQHCLGDCAMVRYSDPGGVAIFGIPRKASCFFAVQDLTSKHIGCTEKGPITRVYFKDRALARLGDCVASFQPSTPHLSVTVDGKLTGITGYNPRHLTISPGPTSDVIAEFLKRLPDTTGGTPSCPDYSP